MPIFTSTDGGFDPVNIQGDPGGHRRSKDRRLAQNVLDRRTTVDGTPFAEAQAELDKFREFRVPQTFTDFLRDSGQARENLSGLQGFQTPTGFNQFAGNVGTAATESGDLTANLGTAIDQSGMLSDALSGNIADARSLTQGSFGSGGGQGGIIGEAIGQTGNLGGELDKLASRVPDLTPALADASLLDTRVRDVGGSIERTLMPAIDLADLGIGGLQIDADALQTDKFADLLNQTGGDIDLLQATADGLNTNKFGGLLDGTRGDLDLLQATADDLNTNKFGGLLDRTAGDIDFLQATADGLNTNNFIGRLDRTGGDLGVLQDTADKLNLSRFDNLIGMAERNTLPGFQGKLDELGVSVDQLLPTGAELTDEFARIRPDALSAESLLPLGAGLTDEFARIRPDALSAKQLLPTGAGLTDEFARIRPDALSADQLLPTGAGLMDEFARIRPDALSADQLLPTGAGLTDEFARIRPDALSADQLLPLGATLTDEFARIRPDALTPEQLLPTGLDLNNLFADIRPDRLLPGDLLPGQDELQLDIDKLNPILNLPGFDDSALQQLISGVGGDVAKLGGQVGKLQDTLPGEFDKVSGPLAELLGRGQGPTLDEIISAIGSSAGGTGADGDGVVNADQTDFLSELRAVVQGMTSGPTTSKELRADPLTESLLRDFAARGGGQRDQLREDLQRLGVLRSGDSADVLGEFDAGQVRGEFDVLGEAAERFRQDRTEGLGSGVSLFGASEQSRLGQGQLDLQNKQADSDILAAVTAALDKGLDLNTGSEKQKQLARMLLSLTGIDAATKAGLLKIIDSPKE